MAIKKAGQLVWRFLVSLRPGKDDDLIDFLQSQENKTETVRQALRMLMESRCQ